MQKGKRTSNKPAPREERDPLTPSRVRMLRSFNELATRRILGIARTVFGAENVLFFRTYQSELLQVLSHDQATCDEARTLRTASTFADVVGRLEKADLSPNELEKISGLGCRTVVCRSIIHGNGVTQGYFLALFGEKRPTRTRADQRSMDDILFLLASTADDGGSELRIHIDPLTGLLERQSAEHEMLQLVHDANERNEELAIALVSLDKFRRVNNALGVSIADQLLRQLAKRLAEHIDDGEIAARKQGDEFLLVLRSRKGAQALPRLDRMLQSVREPFFVTHQDDAARSREVDLSVTVGVSRFPLDADNAFDLTRFASIALTLAKRNRKSGLHLFDRSMLAGPEDDLMLEQELKRAMRESELRLHYQPKFDIHGRAWVGAECLLRWPHPKLGMISPLRFIPVAEESGLIIPLGKWCLTEACRQRKLWLDRGFELGPVSVNVSAVQFSRLDFVGTIRSALRECKLPAELLEIELTESCLMDNVEQTRTHLQGVRDLGVRISVDDFGTGYSSLAYLQKLPVDVLKIDRSFVRELDHAESQKVSSAKALAQAITYLGHQLGMSVLAEGVETEGQRSALEGLGCDEVQGFLFAKPMPPNEIEAKYRAK